MIKKLLTGILFYGTTTFAGGIVGFNQDLLKSNGPVELTPTLSLYVHETLSEENKVFYQSWTGLRTGKWLTSDHALMKGINKQFNLGLGPSYHRENNIDAISLKLYSEFRLW